MFKRSGILLALNSIITDLCSVALSDGGHRALRVGGLYGDHRGGFQQCLGTQGLLAQFREWVAVFLLRLKGRASRVLFWEHTTTSPEIPGTWKRSSRILSRADEIREVTTGLPVRCAGVNQTPCLG